ncbi:MAG: hypothetical protein CMJ49_12310 [Planctomycetaceae bacterium]|nr:hypothetical protein [Planctomycetaceae bacterium]
MIAAQPPSPDLTGKLAVITGASRGLGRRAAVRLAAHGATALLVARTESALAETARTIQSRGGGGAVVLPADLSDPSVVDNLKASARQHGRASILVNAAGVFGPIQMIKDSDPHLWINTQMLNTVAPTSPVAPSCPT